MARIKGVGMLHLVKTLRQQREAVLPLLDDDLTHYLDDRVAVESWYPAGDFQRLLATLIRCVPPNIVDPWVWSGTNIAAWDLTEIFTRMVPAHDVWGMLQRLPAVWRLYYDGGEIVVELEGQRHASVELHGFPHTHEDYCRHLQGYFTEALRLAGSPLSEVELIECVSEPPKARWSVRWTSPES